VHPKHLLVEDFCSVTETRMNTKTKTSAPYVESPSGTRRSLESDKLLLLVFLAENITPALLSICVRFESVINRAAPAKSHLYSRRDEFFCEQMSQRCLFSYRSSKRSSAFTVKRFDTSHIIPSLD
jgi:hypothetical protein